MYILGNVSIYLGFLLAIYALLALVLGIAKKNQKLINSGKGASIGVFLSMATATAVMLYFLATSNFEVKYVFDYTSSDLTILYKLSALWAGNEGSLMLWNFLLTLYIVIIIFSRKLKGTPYVPYVSAILMANALFFFFILSFVSQPFTQLDYVPTEGYGLNPMLQNPGMVAHPVTLYLGYVGLAVPFAFAMAALLLRNMDDFWIKITRRWTLIAWLFLSLGNILGGQWAYIELGWGGYWAWDPVENASFMPWLTATAFLHSVMIQERKNMLKIWNLSLIILSYALTLFGTFLVRSGILTSVHAFSNSTLGMYFLIYMTIAVIGGMYVLFSRLSLIRRDSGQFKSYLSKESSFLLNNLLLVGAAFAVFWGTIYPLVSESLTGTKITVGIPYFNAVSAPILTTLILLMAICPLIAWQKSTVAKLLKSLMVPAIVTFVIMVCLVIFGGVTQVWPLIGFTVVFFMLFTHFKEFFTGARARKKMSGENIFVAMYRLTIRNRRRYGGYLVHIGIAFMAIAIVGSQNYEAEKMQTIAPNESVELNGYTFKYTSLQEVQEDTNTVVYATIDVTKNGKHIATLQPEKIFYQTWQTPSTEVALHSTWKEDLYITLNGWEEDKRVTLHIKIIPLMSYMWLGAGILVIGTIFAIWRGRYGNVTPRYTGVQTEID